MLPVFEPEELEIDQERQQRKERRERRRAMRRADRFWLEMWFKRLWDEIDHFQWRALYPHLKTKLHRAGFDLHLRKWEMDDHNRRERHRTKQALHQQEEIDGREFRERKPLT